MITRRRICRRIADCRRSVLPLTVVASTIVVNVVKLNLILLLQQSPIELQLEFPLNRNCCTVDSRGLNYTCTTILQLYACRFQLVPAFCEHTHILTYGIKFPVHMQYEIGTYVQRLRLLMNTTQNWITSPPGEPPRRLKRKRKHRDVTTSLYDRNIKYQR